MARACLRLRDDGIIVVAFGKKGVVQGGAGEGHIAGAEDGPIGGSSCEAGVDSAERSLARVFVNDGGYVVRQIELGDALLVVGDDDDVGGDLAHPADYAVDEGFTQEGFQGLVAAQASAHAAGENDGGYVGRSVRGFAHRFRLSEVSAVRYSAALRI